VQEILWIALPFTAALGSGLLSYIVMRARMETAGSQEREELVGVRTQLAQQQKTMEEKVRAAEAEARRKALDEFLADVRVEERQYMREIDSPTEHTKCLVLQERVCFRNIPLSQWIERELPVERKPIAIQQPNQPVAISSGNGRRKLLG
jgi:outer membrane murein-binding lipoprotein Lpp